MARTHNRSRMLGIAAAALALSGAGACGSQDPISTTVRTAPAGPTTTIPVATTMPPPRPAGAVDALVEVRGARMHLRCAGSGSTTAVLIAGFTDGGDNWGPLPASLNDRARVCTYARFGTGTSDPPPADQTFATDADDLHALLTAAGEPGPYMVAGHSFGGAEAVTFAARHRDEVTGLLLIDASPTTWFDAVCSVPDDGSDTAKIFVGNCASLQDASKNPERLDARTAFADVSRITSLGGLPTTVVTAADHPYPGLAAAEVARLNTVWDDGQAHWASLSTTSRLVPVQGASHHVHLDHPDLVAQLAHELLP